MICVQPKQKNVLRIQTVCRALDDFFILFYFLIEPGLSWWSSAKACFRALKTQTITHSERAHACRQTILSQHWCLISSQNCILGMNKHHLSSPDYILSSLTLNQTCLAASILCSCSHPKPLRPVLSRRCRTERRQSDDAVVSSCSFLVITNRSIFCCRLQQHIKIHLSLL